MSDAHPFAGSARSHASTEPILLPPNVIDHYYRGGARIAELRGIGLPNEFRPEEWLAATNARAGEGSVGLSRTTDGMLLSDLIAGDRSGWIGVDTAPHGAGDNGLLVKLLDAAQRLPVHVHPDRSFAAAHLNCPYGKTEAWYVLATDPRSPDGSEPSVWLGWTEDVDPDELARRVDAQDSDWMLARMHRVVVRPGDGILVPAGTTHAIGAGVFVAEVQEPTDLSILLEWSITTSDREHSHLGLGFDIALQSLNCRRFDDQQLRSLIRHTDPQSRGSELAPLLPDAADPFFRLAKAAPSNGSAVAVPAGFAVALVIEGKGEIAGRSRVPVSKGQVLAVPYGFGAWQVRGDVQVLVCRPGAGWPDSTATP